jgi:hypothetical protein
VTLLAGQTALWLWLAAGLLFVLATLALLADVQRFIALTEEARSLVPAGLPLFDGEKAAATTAALVRLPAKKDEARPGSLGVAKRASCDRKHEAGATRRRPSRWWQWPTDQSGGGRPGKRAPRVLPP